VADAREALRGLAWSPRYSDLQCIVQTAWKWHVSLQDGAQKAPEGQDA